MYYNLKKVISSIDIFFVLSKFISLKKTKNGYIALCPFHMDKNPSFFLNIVKKKYYCFACHKKGNVLTFIMDYKRLSFKESLDFLSIYLGSNYNIKKRIPKSFDIVNVASDLYFRNLKKNYLFNKSLKFFFYKRNLTFDDINTFKLGFSEYRFSWLSNILFAFGYSENSIFLSGLFFLKNGSFVDRFRNRVVFPIRNIYGQVIAFGGRSLNDKYKPKYINSSETVFFSKRKEFYGLYEAFTAIKSSTIIIVEGYMDVITLYKNGIKNVIAVLGTSFSKEHFKKINSIYKNIIFCYDGDSAGRLASVRTAFSCLQYLQYGANFSFIFLPFGYDPDSFIRSGFKNRFLYFLKKTIPVLDLVFNRLRCKFKHDKYFNKIIFFSDVFKLVNKIKNFYLKKFLFFYFFKTCFDHESIIFNYLKLNIIRRESNLIIPFALHAAFFLLKKKKLGFCVDVNKFLYCNKLSFFSDINIFFEVLVLIKRFNSIELKTINKCVFHKVRLNKFSSYSFDFNSIDIFKSLLVKIYKVCS
ncbi:MAG TPA: DNA primase [Candidatus Azoamicus sp.]